VEFYQKQLRSDLLLVAKNVKGEAIVLDGSRTREELLHERELERFFCPCCKQPVQLKLGHKRMWHFAHRNNRSCPVELENESEYHMLGKLKLFQWLKAQQLAPQLEPFLQPIRQRPDILYADQKTVALEYQCSTIDKALLIKRTNRYKQANIDPIWILGGNRMKQAEHYVFSLTSFDWLFVKCILKSYCLLYFCPQAKNFIFLTNLTPFSSTHILADLHQIPIEKTTNKLLTAFEARTATSRLWNKWLAKKKRWRLTAHLIALKLPPELQSLLYTKRIPLGLVPSEAGQPLKSLIMIETPAIIWQTWLLLEMIDPLTVGCKIYFSDIYSWLIVKVKKRQIKIREFPFIKGSMKGSEPLMEYLERLVELQVLSRMNNGTIFFKVKEVSRPATLNEAFINDEQMKIT
jgi:competence protein CoiA